MSADQPSAKSIFLSALELQGEERVSFVARNCRDDAELQAEVERLLDNQAASDFLESPVPALINTREFQPIQEREGSQVGPYRLMELVGEGGFGLVFVAEQHHPMRRKVALKIIKPGMDTKEVIARFEAERQALALMDHPNIAKILDAGITDSGRPFFAMELIRGVPILDYCDNQELSTKERLQLFMDVCRAVQHAHSKGVIHRDLKPNNILVSPHDGRPVVKIIDFGISKAIGQQLTDKTIYTRLNQMVGTPLYMSPEQAEINALDVDIRSDVYSLGVVLYELLTGTTPFDRERFSKAAYEEIKRIIREEEPPSPSKRLSSLGDTLTTVSKLRRTEPGRLTATVRGELDWIVMCCLEKDRSRRYQTAVELVADVNRYLADEPVQVVPPSTLYRAQKFLRRYRLPVAIVAGYILLSLVGLGLFYTAMQRAKHNEQLAVKSQKRIQEAFERIRHLLEDRALAAALSADRSQFDDAITDLKSTEIGSKSIRYLEALFAISTGELKETHKSMSQQVIANPDDVAAWSILSIIADTFYLDLDSQAEAQARLQTLDATTPIERLLKAYAYPKSGVDTLEDIVREKPGWGVARAMLADGLCELAYSTGDPNLVKRARKEIAIAKLLHPHNDFVDSIELAVITTEYIFVTREPTTQDKHLSLLDRGNSLAKRFDPTVSNSPFGYRAVGEFYAASGQYELAADVWEYLLNSQHAQGAAFFYVPLILLLDRAPNWERDDSLTGYFILSDQREPAISDIRDVQLWNSTNMGKAWRPNHLRWLGLDDELHEAVETAKQVTEGHTWWISNVAKLTTREWTEEEFLKSAGEDRWQMGHHLMVIAFERLADPNRRDEAIDALEEAIELDMRTADFHFWCLATRKILRENPAWPASLRVEKRQSR